MPRATKQKRARDSGAVSRDEVRHHAHPATVARIRRSAAAGARRPWPGEQLLKQPRQRRSWQMVDAILQAAAELFAELGYARTTTNKIAERAGVSVGSLYQYFTSKDSVLACLVEQHHTDVYQVVDSVLSRLTDLTTPIEEALRQLLAELVALHSSNPTLTKALSAEVLRESSAATRAQHGAGYDTYVQVLADLLRNRPDVRRGSYQSMAAVLSQATAHLTRWLAHDLPTDANQAQLMEETVQLLTRYAQR